MITHTRHDHRFNPRDAGVVLPMVLVVVVVLSVIVVALAQYTAVSLRTADVADQNISRLSAAESGMQLALETTTANPASCTGTPTAQTPLNNASVTTTCWRVAELADLDTLYALVVTGEGPDGVVTEAALQVNGANSDNGVKDINGPIYLAAPGGSDLTILPDNGRAVIPDPDNPSANLPGIIRYEPSSGSCPASTTYTAAQWTGTPLLPPQITCSDSGWDDAVVAPQPDFLTESGFLTLATSASSTNPPAIVAPDADGCYVYEPGLYTTPPTLIGPSYFRSGLYYFPAGQVDIDEPTVIGKRTGTGFPDAAAAGLNAACVPAWNADSDDAGAVFVMGSDARVWVKGNTARLHMYGREILDTGVPAEPVDFAIISLTGGQASSTTTQTAFPGVVGATLPINLTTSPTPAKIIDRQNGSSSSLSFYGQVYAPHSWVDTGNAAGGVFVEFLGGIVAGRVTIKTAANVDGFAISVPTEVINAFYIESVATTTGTLSNGVSAVRTRSTEVIGTSPNPNLLSVDSWRVCPRGNC